MFVEERSDIRNVEGGSKVEDGEDVWRKVRRESL